MNKAEVKKVTRQEKAKLSQKQRGKLTEQWVVANNQGQYKGRIYNAGEKFLYEGELSKDKEVEGAGGKKITVKGGELPMWLDESDAPRRSRAEKAADMDSDEDEDEDYEETEEDLENEKLIDKKLAKTLEKRTPVAKAPKNNGKDAPAPNAVNNGDLADLV